MLILTHSIPGFRPLDVMQSAAHICEVCHKTFYSQSEKQQHLLKCVIAGRELKVRVQRLTEEQVLAFAKSAQGGSPVANTKNTIETTMALRSSAWAALNRIRNYESDSQSDSSDEQSDSEWHMHQEHKTSKDIKDQKPKKQMRKSKIFRMVFADLSMQRQFTCNVEGCEAAFELEMSLELHNIKVHRTASWTCAICGVLFLSKPQFNLHAEWHCKGAQIRGEVSSQDKLVNDLDNLLTLKVENEDMVLD